MSAPAGRRRFLAQTGGALAAAGGFGAAPAGGAEDRPGGQGGAFRPVTPSEWVFGVTRMAFLMPGEVAKAAAAGACRKGDAALFP